MGQKQSMIFLVNHTTKEVRCVSEHFTKNISGGLCEAIELVNTEQRGSWFILRDLIVFHCYDAEKEHFPETGLR